MQSFCWALVAFFSFLILHTVSRFPCMWYRPRHKASAYIQDNKKQDKNTETSMPRVRFEPTTPVLERDKTVHALDPPANVIGTYWVTELIRSENRRENKARLWPTPLCWGPVSVEDALMVRLLQSHTRSAWSICEKEYLGLRVSCRACSELKTVKRLLKTPSRASD
jgi:hypothetical protein